MIQIENMTHIHVDAVAQLETLCFADPWSRRSIACEVDNPLSVWLVAVENGDVIGYVGSQCVHPEADVMNVAVHPEHRRKGIAEKLVCALWSVLTADGIDSLTLEVRESNGPAIALYEKMGFQQVGLRKNYYRNPKEHAKILRKDL